MRHAAVLLLLAPTAVWAEGSIQQYLPTLRLTLESITTTSGHVMWPPQHTGTHQLRLEIGPDLRNLQRMPRRMFADGQFLWESAGIRLVDTGDGRISAVGAVSGLHYFDEDDDPDVSWGISVELWDGEHEGVRFDYLLGLDEQDPEVAWDPTMYGIGYSRRF